jgi:Glycosyl transferase family 2
LNAPLAPIILFVYNRLSHTRETVESLKQCRLATESELYIFSDGAKTPADAAKVNEVRNLVRNLIGFQKVVIAESEQNNGLAASVISGVTQVLSTHNRAIVLEDDLMFSSDFLVFMNEALEYYKNNASVFSISGYNYPINIPQDYDKDAYLLPRASSWGWATWTDRWVQADWQITDYQEFINDKQKRKEFAQGGEDLVYMLMKQQKGMINSWAVRWSYAHYKHHGYCLFPKKSKVRNIGNDKSGTHSPRTTRFDTQVGDESVKFDGDLEINPIVVRNLQKFFRPSLYRKMINYYRLR